MPVFRRSMPIGGRAARLAVLGLLLLLVASAGIAQRRFRGSRGFARAQFGFDPAMYDGAFNFCRIAFRQSPSGDGAGWNVDWPRADENLSVRLSELTKAPVSFDGNQQPNHVLLTLTDPGLFQCPFIMMTEVGGLYLDDSEATALRTYLVKGGFLWADDFWGPVAWQNFSEEIAKALPPDQYPIQDLPLTHPIFDMMTPVASIPQIPSIDFWEGTGQTSERGARSVPPHVRAIDDANGRILVLITFDTDFGDAFEREGDDHEYFLKFSVPGYAFGINALLYAMTH
jgi:Domain of unknown function (DUF4159)